MGCRKASFAVLLVFGLVWFAFAGMASVMESARGGFMITTVEEHGAYRVTSSSLHFELIFTSFLALVGLAIAVIGAVQWRAKPEQIDAGQAAQPLAAQLGQNPDLYYKPRKTAAAVVTGFMFLLVGLGFFGCGLWPLMVGARFTRDYGRDVLTTGSTVSSVVALVVGLVFIAAGVNGMFSTPKPRRVGVSAASGLATAGCGTMLVLVLLIAAILGALVVTNPSEADHKQAVYTALHDEAARSSGLGGFLGGLAVRSVQDLDALQFHYENHIFYSTLTYNGRVVSNGFLGQVSINR